MVLVAGHICLDIIPALRRLPDLTPGRLNDVGSADLSAGGAVGNVAQVLRLLGINVAVFGATGRDGFAELLRQTLLVDNVHLQTHDSVATSYTLVISSPGRDRVFLHHSGANDIFSASELTAFLRRYDGSAPWKWLHFGYPPLMQAIMEDGGQALAEAFRVARSLGMRVSLDLATLDPTSAKRTDWHGFLARVLPEVDVFAPSYSDLVSLNTTGSDEIGYAGVSQAADQALSLGVQAVLIKLGEFGTYLKTAADAPFGSDWLGRELASGSYQVETYGTTGSGDATVAGFLAALLDNSAPEKALAFANAVGAASVEHADGSSALPTRQDLRKRMQTGWPRRPSLTMPQSIPLETGLTAGPQDSRGVQT